MQVITKEEIRDSVVKVSIEISELEKQIKNLQAKKRRRQDKLNSLLDLCDGQIKIEFDE
jgi:septal ring factor EnvC (AmiA/AmiB activator)